jgi:hypothetical protein
VEDYILDENENEYKNEGGKVLTIRMLVDGSKSRETEPDDIPAE